MKRRPNIYCPKGFTMIEMLVALTIFGLAMSSLVLGLQVSIKSWEGIRKSQRESATLARALRVLREAVEHAVLREEIPALQEAAPHTGRETLTFSRVRSGDPLAALRAYEGAEVTFYLEDSEQDMAGPYTLMQRITPYVGVTALARDMWEEPLLPGVRALAFAYGNGDDFEETWTDETQMPGAIRIDLDTTSYGEQRLTLALPLGWRP